MILYGCITKAYVVESFGSLPAFENELENAYFAV